MSHNTQQVSLGNKSWVSRALEVVNLGTTGTQQLQGLSAESEEIKSCKSTPIHRITVNSPCSSYMVRCRGRGPHWLKANWSLSKWVSDTGISRLSEEGRSSLLTTKDFPVRASRCSRGTTASLSFNCQRLEFWDTKCSQSKMITASRDWCLHELSNMLISLPSARLLLVFTLLSQMAQHQ